MRRRIAYVSVEVDLGEVETEDLVEELESRGEFCKDERIAEMFYAFKLGRDDRAIEIAKEIAQEHMGMILC